MTTLHLSDLQLLLLSAAVQRADGSLLPPPDGIGERTPAIDKAIKSLLRRGLAAKPDASDISDPSPADKNRLIGVRITAAGRAAIGAGQDEGEEDRSPEEPGEKSRPETESSSRPVSKIGTVLSLLQREEGATLDEMVAATGWLPHTTRAALTGLRKKGHAVAKDKRGDTTRYRIAPRA